MGMRIRFLGVFLLMLAQLSLAQTGPISGLYVITSGHYSECCGFAGAFDYDLPDANQTFIDLRINTDNDTARMRFLGEDRRTVFHTIHSMPNNSFTFDLTNGQVFPDHIQFGDPLQLVDPIRPAYSYVVSNSFDMLFIDGAVKVPCDGCSDIPTRFMHSNVVAVLMPTISSITDRGAEIEICWTSLAGASYQVQYRTLLTPDEWRPLGSPVTGNGTTICARDALPRVGQRFFRVTRLPR